MSNEEKASEIVIKIQNSGSLDYDGRRAKYMYESAMEMAEWKDEQWKKRLQDAFIGAWTASLTIENNEPKRTTTISFKKVED